MLSHAQIAGQNSEHLVELEEGHLLHPRVCKAFKRMQFSAKQAGIDLAVASSHRDYGRQLAIWERKWKGELPLYNIHEELIEGSVLGDSEKLHAILTWSALPGASRHHWGTDLDVFDAKSIEESGQKLRLVASEYAQDGPCFSLNTWLGEHAESFGFTRPYNKYYGGVAPEPWHISYQPIASEIYRSLNLNELRLLIQTADISGKDTILANLDGIFNRYILNRPNS